MTLPCCFDMNEHNRSPVEVQGELREMPHVSFWKRHLTHAGALMSEVSVLFATRPDWRVPCFALPGMTTIASYLAYCHPGAKLQLRQDLAGRCCEVLAAENEDVLVLVTEQANGKALDQFEADSRQFPARPDARDGRRLQSRGGRSKTMNRRDLLKTLATSAAIAAARAALPDITFAAPVSHVPVESLTWQKSPCRFCGTGCGLLIGITNGRAAAVKGDPASSVNKGLCCVKGYHSIMALYGQDRLKQALVRKNGKLVPVPMQEALDLVANRMKETIAQHGKDSVAIYGSGQWTIQDGYIASKLFKAGIGTNNIEANARLCMASAVSGFATTFGLDEPMGCYDDIDHADTFVLWGNNMAENHPVLFSRMLEQRALSGAKIIDLTTRTTRTSSAADRSLLFQPQTDLALANAIAYEIIRNHWHNVTFLQRHVSFHTGKTDIGYGLEDNFQFEEAPQSVDFDRYASLLATYAPKKWRNWSAFPPPISAGSRRCTAIRARR